jgi:hypothetical protein
VKRISKLLVIPDAHANPAYDNGRFDVLGKLIADERPNVIIQTGDWGCMPSLSHYDKGTLKAEGRRYKDDCLVTQDSLARVAAPIRRLAYRPKLFLPLGNHEERINKAVNKDPELHGAISVRDLGFEDHGWEVLPYEEVLSLAGWSFCHHFTPGKGKHPASTTQALLKATYGSAIVGHKHTLEEAMTTRPDRTRIHSIFAGCYTHLKHREGWNKSNQHQDMNGVLILDDVEAGHYGAKRFITQERLWRVYG